MLCVYVWDAPYALLSDRITKFPNWEVAKLKLIIFPVPPCKKHSPQPFFLRTTTLISHMSKASWAASLCGPTPQPQELEPDHMLHIALPWARSILPNIFISDCKTFQNIASNIAWQARLKIVLMESKLNMEKSSCWQSSTAYPNIYSFKTVSVGGFHSNNKNIIYLRNCGEGNEKQQILCL